MIRIFEYKKDFKTVEKFIESPNVFNRDIENTVKEIISNVRENGDRALLEYIKKFDNVQMKKSELRVSENEICEAVRSVDKKFIKILNEAKENIIKYHKKGIKRNFLYNDGDNVKLGKIVNPIENVGVYIPGGKAVYPSSVLMNVIPAKIAGVKNIYIASPPDKEKKINKCILTACYVLNVKNIFKMGGAQAISAFAYGTETIPKVDKIVGPGNIYVATAKRLVYGDVDIDIIAGPSEVVVVADSSSSPECIAGELLAQAEHDEDAHAICLTTSKKVAYLIRNEIIKQIKLLSRKEIIKKSLKNNGAIIIIDNLKNSIALINKIAPEHLQISIKDSKKILNQIKNAGAVFVGKYSPVAVGDYFAGPNHTLPTGGSARFSSPLSVNDFLKEMSVIFYSKERLKKVSDSISQFALLEGLDAHAISINIRLKY
jgi:histidinol dehydrogenase